ncbi:chloride channel protein [Yinghuangia aomiensis]
MQRNLGWRTLVCASAVSVPLAAYSLITDRSPDEAALSGQAMLGQLAASPHELSVGALIALVVCKALAWSVCLAALRGGPIFPSLLLGAATAMACSGLPGLHPTPALALGMAAGAAVVTGLPLTSSVLAVLLMGPDAFDQMPLIVVAAVVGFAANRLMPPRSRPGGARGGCRGSGRRGGGPPLTV